MTSIYFLFSFRTFFRFSLTVWMSGVFPVVLSWVLRYCICIISSHQLVSPACPAPALRLPSGQNGRGTLLLSNPSLFSSVWEHVPSVIQGR